MYRNSYAPSSASSNQPPPAYNGYARPPQPPYPPPTDGPPPPRPWNGYPQQDRRDDYQFRGPYSDLRRPHSEDRRRDDGEYRTRYRDNDNYRPPQGDFTFRVERPSGIDSYVPPGREQRPSGMYDARRPQPRVHDTHPRYSRDDERGSSNHSRRDGNARPTGPQNSRSRRLEDRKRQRQQGTQNRGRIRYDRQKEKPSARLLLLKKHDENPELMLGDTAGRATYRDIDDLSDSDEAEMDISDNSDAEATEPASKRMRTSETPATKPDQDVPRWSNPDPYTALPPPDETTRKKKDMVQLIRKARVEAEAKKPSAPIEGLDFISCDFSDNEGDSKGTITDDKDSVSGKSRPPVEKQGDERRGEMTLPPKPSGLSGRDSRVERMDTRAAQSNLQGNNKTPVDLTASTTLGSRKRTYDDTIKLPPAPVKPPMKFSGPGNVLSYWQPKDGEPSCPWAVTDHSATPSLATRLHKEVMDFYLYVRPRDSEERVRNQMLENLQTIVKKKWPDANIYPFGSFMSGLYLPTADMDIAICSDSFVKRGIPKYDKKKDLWNLKAHLLHHGVVRDNEIEVISKAKVPLVKFADSGTALKVDISFEKMDGHRAIKTFLDWKEKYPAMPILVSVIKHFLLMRGLNEPVNGGIGGFTVICMVVNLLNMMPQVQSGSMKPEHHLGELLMEFFDYYGNHFQYNTVAIRMNPPGLVPKSEVSNVVYRNMDRLSILDPNNPQNDIAGGSGNTAKILAQFSKAHATIRARMAELAKGTKATDFGNTILGPLFAGNYSIFQVYRSHLERLDVEGIPEYQRHRSWASNGGRR